MAARVKCCSGGRMAADLCSPAQRWFIDSSVFSSRLDFGVVHFLKHKASSLFQSSQASEKLTHILIVARCNNLLSTSCSMNALPDELYCVW